MKSNLSMFVVGVVLAAMVASSVAVPASVQEVSISDGSQSVPSVSFDTNGNPIIQSNPPTGSSETRTAQEQPTIQENVQIDETFVEEEDDETIEIVEEGSDYGDEEDEEDQDVHDPEGDTYTLCRTSDGRVVECDSVDCADAYCIEVEDEEQLEDEDAEENNGHYSSYYRAPI